MALARAARKGDRHAAERLGQRLRYVPRVLAALNTRHGRPLSSHELEDLSQDTLLVIWRKLDGFQGLGALEAWTQRFCYLEFMNRLRRVSRHATPVSAELAGEVQAAELPNPERTRALEGALDELSPERAAVIRLRHFQGWQLDRVAGFLGIPVNTAKTRYHRGILQLQEKLWRLRPDGAREESRR